MRRIIIITIIILVLCSAIAGCSNTNKYIKNIKADDIIISYEQSTYKSYGRLDRKTINGLIYDYSKLEMCGTTTKDIDYDKAISIIFNYEGQTIAQAVVDPSGICHLNTNKKNLTYNTNSELYDEGLRVYKELKKEL